MVCRVAARSLPEGDASVISDDLKRSVVRMISEEGFGSSVVLAYDAKQALVPSKTFKI